MATVLSQGTTVSIDDNVSSPVNIGGVVNAGFGDGTSKDIDVTTLASTAREFRPGLQDFGDCTITLLRDPDDLGQQELLSAKAAQALRTFIVVLNDGSTLDTATFEGYVKTVPTDIPEDDVLKGTAQVKISGGVDWS